MNGRVSSFSRLKAWRAAVALSAVFAASVIVAMLSTPGYRPFAQVLSDLGVGPGAAWFNYGLVATAVLLSVFFALHFLGQRRTLFTRLGLGTGIVSCACVALAGLENERTALHGPASTAFFAFATISVILFESAKPGRLLSPSRAAAALLSSSVVALAATHYPPFEWLAVLALGAWAITASSGPE